MPGLYEYSFQSNLKVQRMRMKPAERKRTRKNVRQKIWLYPYALEREYNQFMVNSTLKVLWETSMPIFENNLTKWKREIQRDTDFKIDNLHFDEISGNWLDENDSLEWIYDFREPVQTYNYPVFVHRVMQDTFEDELNRLIRELNKKLNEIFGTNTEEPEKAPIWPGILAIGSKIFQFNRKQWEKQTSQILGFPFTTDDSWWGRVRNRWAYENFRLWRNVNEDFISRTNEIVYRGVREGVATRQIRDELQRTLNITKNRAMLIARDQTGKLNAEISKNRMTEAGINIYIWRTAKDERVRETHKEMEGKLCRFDNNNVMADSDTDVIRNNDGTIKDIKWRSRPNQMQGAIPGSQIQCRCVQIPWWEPVLQEADESIGERVA